MLKNDDEAVGNVEGTRLGVRVIKPKETLKIVGQVVASNYSVEFHLEYLNTRVL